MRNKTIETLTSTVAEYFAYFFLELHKSQCVCVCTSTMEKKNRNKRNSGSERRKQHFYCHFMSPLLFFTSALNVELASGRARDPCTENTLFACLSPLQTNAVYSASFLPYFSLSKRREWQSQRQKVAGPLKEGVFSLFFVSHFGCVYEKILFHFE